MTSALRLGIASQTPLVRAKRTGSLPPGPLSPLDLARLKRGVDYSVTPGGVARMVQGFLRSPAAGGLEGEWATLGSGFGRDILLGAFRLVAAELPPEAAADYKRFKEEAWEALNGLPPRIGEPLDDPARGGYEAWSLASTARLLESDAEAPFDVFYVNDWQMLPAGQMLGGRPRVMHFHAPIDAWTPPGWRDFALHYLRDFDGVVVSTHAYARFLRRAGLDVPIHQVYPWVDPRLLRAPPPATVRAVAERFGVRPEERVILNVARMDPVKGQDRLLRAFARIAPRFPDVRLVCVGNGSFSSSRTAGMGLSKGKVWRGKLEALVAELGLGGRVVFTGHLPQVDVDAFYHRADVFAFPSVAEGFGLAVAEGWLAGKPVVVSPGAGIAELIRDGENGFLADAADTEAFADALAKVLSLPDGGKEMGAEGRRTALRHGDVRRNSILVRRVLDAHAAEGPHVKAQVDGSDAARA